MELAIKKSKDDEAKGLATTKSDSIKHLGVEQDTINYYATQFEQGSRSVL